MRCACNSHEKYKYKKHIAKGTLKQEIVVNYFLQLQIVFNFVQRIGGIPEAGLCSGPDRTITNENVSYAFVQPLDEMARSTAKYICPVYMHVC